MRTHKQVSVINYLQMTVFSSCGIERQRKKGESVTVISQSRLRCSYSSPVDEQSQKSSCAKTDVGAAPKHNDVCAIRFVARRAATCVARWTTTAAAPPTHPAAPRLPKVSRRPIDALAPGTSLLFLSVLYLCRATVEVYGAGFQAGRCVHDEWMWTWPSFSRMAVSFWAITSQRLATDHWPPWLTT